MVTYTISTFYLNSLTTFSVQL